MTPEEEQLMKEETDESYAEALMKIIAKQSAKAYPVYQYSYFVNGSRDEQLVIRADNFEEFKEAKRNIDTVIEKLKAKQKDTPIPIEEFEVKCEKCGAKKIQSKKGNMICSNFCWTKK